MRLLALGKSPSRYTSPTSLGCGGYGEEEEGGGPPLNSELIDDNLLDYELIDDNATDFMLVED